MPLALIDPRTHTNKTPPSHASTHAGKNQGLFNNAAQVWNHNFYWNCMKQGGGGPATGKVAELIKRDFGDFDKFKVRASSGGRCGV